MTRFAGWQPGLARTLLAALLALMAVGLLVSVTPVSTELFTTNDPMRMDGELYRAVAERVSGGEGYYEAAAAEHRYRGYPLKPFVTMRLPTLAWLVASLGPAIASWLMMLLVVVVLVAASLRFRDAFGSLLGRCGAMAAAACGVVLLAHPDLVVWHEAWAGSLIALSLLCRGEGRYAASLLLGVAAASIRELAAPYLLAMAFVAVLEGRRSEAVAWLAGTALVAIGIAAHAVAVSSHVLPADVVSPGWTSFGGWNLVLTMVKAGSPLSFLPPVWSAITVPLALLGWAAWSSPTGLRGFLVVLGYVGGFMAIGRADNAYWGMMLAPVLFIGLAFAPGALTDLVRAATTGRRSLVASGMA